MVCSFHFERLISQKKILRIHISPEGFDPVYRKHYFWVIDIFAEGNHFLILLQKESLQFINIFHFERFSSQKRTLLMIDIFSERNFLLSFCRRNFLMQFCFENLFCRRKFFLLTLPKKKMEFIIIHYFQILLQKEYSYI